MNKKIKHLAFAVSMFFGPHAQADIYKTASPAAKLERLPAEQEFWNEDPVPQPPTLTEKPRSENWKRRARIFTNYVPGTRSVWPSQRPESEVKEGSRANEK